MVEIIVPNSQSTACDFSGYVDAKYHHFFKNASHSWISDAIRRNSAVEYKTIKVILINELI